MQKLKFNLDEYFSHAEKLVNIDSGTYDVEGKKKVIAYYEKLFQEMNFKTYQVETSDKVGNMLVAQNKEGATEFDVVLIGHSDTVYEVGQAEKYPFRYKNDKKDLVYGLGLCDMKGAVLAGMYAIQELSPEELDSLSICFIVNPDEETGSVYSAKPIAEIAKHAKCCLVLESCERNHHIVHKRKGIARYQVNVTGVACHGSAPERGASAILEMVNFIQKLDKKYGRGGVPGTAYNVGLISGGQALNVVPPSGWFQVEFRFGTKELYEEIQKDMKQFSSELLNSNLSMEVNEKTSMEVEQLSYKPPLVNSPENKWIEELVFESSKKAGLDVTLVESPGGSDGNEISDLGIPTIDGIGPRGYGIHNAEHECVIVESIPERVGLVTQILKDLNEKFNK